MFELHMIFIRFPQVKRNFWPIQAFAYIKNYFKKCEKFWVLRAHKNTEQAAALITDALQD